MAVLEEEHYSRDMLALLFSRQFRSLGSRRIHRGFRRELWDIANGGKWTDLLSEHHVWVWYTPHHAGLPEVRTEACHAVDIAGVYRRFDWGKQSQ